MLLHTSRTHIVLLPHWICCIFCSLQFGPYYGMAMTSFLRGPIDRCVEVMKVDSLCRLQLDFVDTALDGAVVKSVCAITN